MLHNSFDYRSMNYYNYRLNYRGRDTFFGKSSLVHYFYAISHSAIDSNPYNMTGEDTFDDNSFRLARYNFVVAACYNDRRKKYAKVTFTNSNSEKPKCFWQISIEEVIDNYRDKKTL